jgi:hypothetical protein
VHARTTCFSASSSTLVRLCSRVERPGVVTLQLVYRASGMFQPGACNATWRARARVRSRQWDIRAKLMIGTHSDFDTHSPGPHPLRWLIFAQSATSTPAHESRPQIRQKGMKSVFVNKCAQGLGRLPLPGKRRLFPGRGVPVASRGE